MIYTNTSAAAVPCPGGKIQPGEQREITDDLIGRFPPVRVAIASGRLMPVAKP
jgi:hypothetical protein